MMLTPWIGKLLPALDMGILIAGLVSFHFMELCHGKAGRLLWPWYEVFASCLEAPGVVLLGDLLLCRE